MVEVLLNNDSREDIILDEYDRVEKFYLTVLIVSFLILLISGLMSLT